MSLRLCQWPGHRSLSSVQAEKRPPFCFSEARDKTSDLLRKHPPHGPPRSMKCQSVSCSDLRQVCSEGRRCPTDSQVPVPPTPAPQARVGFKWALCTGSEE